MHRAIVSLFIGLLILGSLSHGAREFFSLGVGDAHYISAEGVQKVLVQKEGVVRVEPVEDGRVKVVALAPGSVLVRAQGAHGERVYSVRVHAQSALQHFQKIKQVAQKAKGLSAHLLGGRTYVRGRLNKMQDWHDLAALRVPYSFSALVPKALRLQSLLFFSELSQAHHLPVPLIYFYPETYVSLGGAKDSLDLNRVRSLFKAYGLTVHHNPQQLLIEPTLRIQVVLAEVNLKSSRLYGLNWGSGYEAELFKASPKWPSLKVALNAMATKGHGQILAAPTLLCRNKGEAKFLAGGEFAVVRQISRFRSSVSWKEHGIKLTLKPQVRRNGRMKLDVDIGISLIDESQKIPGGMPALKTNKVSTQFDLNSSQSVYLSGLIRRSLGRSSDGLPLLKDIPILGALFGSRAFQKNKTDLVIFITPELVNHKPI